MSPAGLSRPCFMASNSSGLKSCLITPTPGGSVSFPTRSRASRHRPRWRRRMPDAIPIPGLLVSVRNVEEAHRALEGGAALIDVKEPSRGALGRADDNVIAAVVAAVAGRRPV